MLKIILSFAIVVFLSAAAAAQTGKSVTNFDLEKFRQQRLQNEANYDLEANRGNVPTRAELAEREAERRLYLNDFARRDAERRAEEARINAENLRNENQALRNQNAAQNQFGAGYNGYDGFSTPFVYSTGYAPYYNGYNNGGIYQNRLNSFRNGFYRAGYSNFNNNGLITGFNGGIAFGNPQFQRQILNNPVRRPARPNVVQPRGRR